MGNIFRPFTTTADRRTVSAKLKLRKEVARAKRRAEEIRLKLQKGEPLTDADVRLLAKMGPKTLKAIGYAPRVTLT